MCKLEAIEILHEVCNLSQDVFPNGFREAYLYGSYARGDFDNESDVDILLIVDLEPLEISHYRNQIAAISSDLSLSHDVTMSISVKPYKQFRQYSSVLPFYKNVLAEGIRYPVQPRCAEDS